MQIFMNRKRRNLLSRFTIVGLFLLITGFAQAATVSHLSGTYQIVGTTERGPDTQVRLQVSLVNHGLKNLEIQRIALWGSAHPSPEAMTAGVITLRAASTVTTTSEFLVPTSDLRLWTRGTPVRLLVTVEDPEGRKTTELVPLDRIFAGKAN
jgi:hypothetical protein